MKQNIADAPQDKYGLIDPDLERRLRESIS